MQTVNLSPIFHNKEERIGVYFTYNKAINDTVQHWPMQNGATQKNAGICPAQKKPIQLF